IAMLISVVVQLMFHRKYVIDPNKKILGLSPEGAPKMATNPFVIVFSLIILSGITIALLYIDANVFSYLFYLLMACIIFIAIIIFTDKTLNRVEKNKVAVIFTVSFFVVFFWSAFEQAGASLTVFADRQTQRDLGFFVV